MLCWSWSDTAGQPQQVLCVWNPGGKVGGVSGLTQRKISPEAWPSSCAWAGQQSHSSSGPAWDQTWMATFNIVNLCLSWKDRQRFWQILLCSVHSKFIFWDMHIFSLWCYWIFFVSLLSFPWPFIAQIWQQHFRCTKGIESTFPSQSGGVWVSNISLTDFLGGKKHFSLTWRGECTVLAEIKGPVKKCKGPQHGLYRGARWHRRTLN